jgi:HPr Serine kinase C-terminal domain
MHLAEVCGAGVRWGPVPAPPSQLVVDTELWSGTARLAADRDRAVLRVAGLGEFAVSGGVDVVVDPAPGADAGTLEAMLHGTVVALLLAQRGQFALHASTVAVGGAGLAVAGARGAGKSTAAFELDRRGHRLVTDDVSPIIFRGCDVTNPVVVPFGRRRHVWPATARALGLDLTGSEPVGAAVGKLSLPAPDAAPTPLHAVAVLQSDPGAADLGAARLRGMAAASALLGNAYRGPVLRALWHNELFAWSAALAGQLPVWLVNRPQDTWTVPALADLLEQLAATSPRWSAEPAATVRPTASPRPGTGSRYAATRTTGRSGRPAAR